MTRQIQGPGVNAQGHRAHRNNEIQINIPKPIYLPPTAQLKIPRYIPAVCENTQSYQLPHMTTTQFRKPSE